jgi:CelD/BcsL family acetyltransferase involved in cellulose biosynthesis
VPHAIGMSAAQASSPNSPGSFSAPSITVRVLSAAQIDASTHSAWVALEARALEPNAYLSPHFVLPALKHLDAHIPARIVLVERRAAGMRSLIAAGVFEHVLGTRQFPMPYWRAYRSKHSFMGGVLLDHEHAAVALSHLLQAVQGNQWRLHGIDFGLVWADGAQAALLQTTLRAHGMRVAPSSIIERAVLRPAGMGDAGLAALPSSRQQHMRRQWRKLEKSGAPHWAAVRDAQAIAKATQTFLDLENMGWKHQHGSALAACTRDAAFFHAMVQGFASEGRAVFTELSVDGRVVSSTSNFVSGYAGFAFKVGWDPEFKSCSPARLNEWEFVRHAAQVLPEVTFLDSGANPGSYIEDFWLDRRPMGYAMAATTTAGAAALGMIDAARALKRSTWINLAVPVRDLSTALITFV